MVARIRIGCPTPTVLEETTIFSTDKFFGASFPKSTQVNSGLLGVEDNLSRNASTAALSQSSQSCFLKSESRIISRFKFFPSAVIERPGQAPITRDDHPRVEVFSPKHKSIRVRGGFVKMGVVIPPSWRMLVSDCVCIFPRKPEIKSCARKSYPQHSLKDCHQEDYCTSWYISRIYGLTPIRRKPRARSPVTVSRHHKVDPRISGFFL